MVWIDVCNIKWQRGGIPVVPFLRWRVTLLFMRSSIYSFMGTSVAWRAWFWKFRTSHAVSHIYLMRDYIHLFSMVFAPSDWRCWFWISAQEAEMSPVRDLRYPILVWFSKDLDIVWGIWDGLDGVGVGGVYFMPWWYPMKNCWDDPRGFSAAFFPLNEDFLDYLPGFIPFTALKYVIWVFLWVSTVLGAFWCRPCPSFFNNIPCGELFGNDSCCPSLSWYQRFGSSKVEGVPVY